MNLEYNLRGLLHLFFRQKTKFLITLALILIPAILLTLRIEPHYESKSSLLLKFGQNARLEVNLQGTQTYKPSNSNERKEIMQSNVRIIKSVDLIKAALEDKSLSDMYPQLAETALNKDQKLQKAAQTVQNNLTVVAGKDNYLIEVSFKHKNPQIATNVTKAIIKTFRERHTEIYETPQTNFLEEQSIKAQEKLKLSREAFVEFKKQAGISEIDREIEQLLRQKNELSTASYKSQTEAIAYQSMIQAQEKLAELEAEAAKLRTTYREDSPVVKSMNDSLAIARGELRNRKSDLSRIGSRLTGSINVQNNQINERIGWLEQQRGRYNELAQQVKLDEENSKYYRQRMEEARINNMLNAEDITSISVIDAPTTPLKPSGPDKRLFLIAAIIFASVIAAAIAILYELMDERVSFPNQIRSRLGLPVLATFTEKEGA